MSVFKVLSGENQALLIGRIPDFALTLSMVSEDSTSNVIVFAREGLEEGPHATIETEDWREYW